MKRLFTLFFVVMLVCIGASAQRADIRKAVERYKNANTLTANVTQTKHNVALTKDAVTKGYFYYQKPSNLSMVFKDSKEKLIATGNNFIMIKNGKQHVAKAKGKGNNPFETLREVFRNLLSSNDNAKLTDMADVNMKKQGNTCTITITPTVTDAKAKRRMMFTSCVVTIDLKAGEIRRLRINEKRGNYTQYDFSNYVFNAKLNSNAFKATI